MTGTGAAMLGKWGNSGTPQGNQRFLWSLIALPVAPEMGRGEDAWTIRTARCKGDFREGDRGIQKGNRTEEESV